MDDEEGGGARIASGPDHLILRDHLAVDRTRLANERTFLSYLRTSLSFLAGGGAVIVYFREDALLSAAGYVFVVLALASFAVGFYKYLSMKKRIEEEKRAVRDEAKGLREYLRMRRLATGGELKK